MSSKIKYIKLKRSDIYGFGFSILGGAGSELPPLIYDIIEGSPASQSNQLCPGDIILEINGKDVLAFTTKEVLNCLRLSSKEVLLKLKTDHHLQKKVEHLRQAPNNSEILRTAITHDDLQGVKQILAKKDELNIESCSKAVPRSQMNVDTPVEYSPRVYTSENKSESIGTEENDFSHPQERQRSELNPEAGDLTLDFSIAHPNPCSVPCQVSPNSAKKSTSMPTSPNDHDKGLDGMDKNDRHGLSSPQSLCSPLSIDTDACHTFIYPTSTSLVRISKSEDYLQCQKDNMSSVNIDLEDDVTSSLNTLLDTRDDPPACSSVVPVVSHILNNHNKDDFVWTLNSLALPPSSPPGSTGHSSHDSDSPLIHSLSPLSPHSPTSSMQYSCSGVYNKMCSARDSFGSSNRSEHVCSNSSGSSLTSPDTDVPDELEWDDTTPSFSPINQIFNGFSDKNATIGSLVVNGHSSRSCPSPTDSSISDSFVQKLDENRIIIKVAGPEKGKKTKRSSFSSHRKRSQDKGSAFNGDPDRTPTNTPPQTPGSGTLSPETLAYQQLWESEDEITCLSEKSDESSSTSAANKEASQRTPCASSPPLSEDESDIESLHSFHYSPKAVDLPSAIRLAKRLFVLDGFKKSDVSRHLSKNNEFSKAVAEEYLRYFDFLDDTLDVALRKFLDKFCLSGETQERERVLVHFSKRFLDCNPGTFNSQDAVHTLTCALMLLNTDLHGQGIGHRMTCPEFIANLAELNDGENFHSDTLKSIYEAIRLQPLKWAKDDDDDEGKGSKGLEESHHIIGSNPFLSAPTGNGVVYKKGYIMRKSCMEPNGKRTAFGKRSWKMWFCVIQDLVLYLHKDEQGAKRGPLPQVGQNAVRLHHALAQKAHDYSKKEHVFRLQTADQAEYLLQTSDSKELQAWIDAINFVAASLSAAPMPGAVGSQHKFQRPLLPCSITKLNVMEQLEDHMTRLRNIEADLDHLKSHPPDKAAKSTFVSSYKEKEAYLISEVKRYQMYVHLLQSRLEAVGSSAQGTVAVCTLGLNELPVLEAKQDTLEVKEVGHEEGVSAAIVPPPIPERSRHADSEDEEAKMKTSIEVDNTEEKGIQTNRNPTKIERRNSKKEDEFKKELNKMIKEKEKRDKKQEKKEAAKQKQKARTINDTVSKERSNVARRDSTSSEDPRMGTLSRLTAIFKFNKLNSKSGRSSSYEVEQMELLNKCQANARRSFDGNFEIGSFPVAENCDPTKDTPTQPSQLEPEVQEREETHIVPPPLPPKPSLNSPVRKNLGTRVINV